MGEEGENSKHAGAQAGWAQQARAVQFSPSRLGSGSWEPSLTRGRMAWDARCRWVLRSQRLQAVQVVLGWSGLPVSLFPVPGRSQGSRYVVPSSLSTGPARPCTEHSTSEVLAKPTNLTRVVALVPATAVLAVLLFLTLSDDLTTNDPVHETKKEENNLEVYHFQLAGASYFLPRRNSSAVNRADQHDHTGEIVIRGGKKKRLGCEHGLALSPTEENWGSTVPPRGAFPVISHFRCTRYHN